MPRANYFSSIIVFITLLLSGIGHGPFAAPPSVKWTFPTAGAIWSSPAIGDDGTIYVGSRDRKLYAVNPDGSQRWQFEAGIVSGDIWSPSVSEDGSVYIAPGDGQFYGLDNNGIPQWTFGMGLTLTASPSIATDGTIYLESIPLVVALAPDGNLIWEAFTGILNSDTSKAAIGSDRTIYVCDNPPGWLTAITPSGDEKWFYVADPFRPAVCSSPVIGPDGTIFITTLGSDPAGNLHAVNENGTVEWKLSVGNADGAFLAVEPYLSEPVIGSDGTVYVVARDPWFDRDNGVVLHKESLTAVFPNGGSVRWVAPLSTLDNLLSDPQNPLVEPPSPAIGADGTVYIASADGNLYAINPDGTQRWVFQIGGPIGLSSPVIGADGAIYVGSLDGQLYAIDAGAGGLLNSSWAMFGHDARHTGQADIGLSIFPNTGGDSGLVSVQIKGSGIVQGSTVQLVKDGLPNIIGDWVTVGEGETTLLTTFDLTDQSQGLWDVVVTNPDGTVFTLPEGFTIEAGVGEQLWAEIIAPPAIRAGQPAQFFVAYGNKGNVDATYPWLAIALPADVEYSVSAPNAWPPGVADAAPPSGDTLKLTLLELPPLPPGSSDIITVELGPVPADATIPIRVNITTDAMSFFEAERILADKVAPALVGVDTTGLPGVNYSCDYQAEVYNPEANVFPAGTMFLWSTPTDLLKKIEDEIGDLATHDCPSKYFDVALDDGKKCFGWHVAKSIGCGQFVDMLSDSDADNGIHIRTLDDNWLNHQGTFETRPSSLDSEGHRTEVRETALANYKVFGISDGLVDRDHYVGGICESDYTPENGLTTNCLGLFYILNPELAKEKPTVPANIFMRPGYVDPNFLTFVSGNIKEAQENCPDAVKKLEGGPYREIPVVTSIDPNDKYGPVWWSTESLCPPI